MQHELRRPKADLDVPGAGCRESGCFECEGAMTKAEHAARIRAWRIANPARDRSIARAAYARNRVKRLAAKRDQYQRIGKAREKTSEGRLRDRMKKETRRARIAGSVATLTKGEWIAICAAQDCKCFYCFVPAPLEQDHVVALSTGGQHTAANVVGACKRCNSSKGNRASRPIYLGAACG